MSLLDQVLAFQDRSLDAATVARVLGVASHGVLHDLVGALVGGDAAKCVAIVGAVADQGFDIPVVTRDVLALLRDLVVAKVCADPKAVIDRADDELRDVQALAATTTADDLVRLQQGFSASFDDVVRGAHPRAGLEMLLVRLARRPPLVPIDDLVARLDALERRLAGARAGGPPSSGPAPSAGRGGSRRPETAPRGEPRSSDAPEVPRDPLEAWRRLLAVVERSLPDLASVLAHAVPRSVDAAGIVLAVEKGGLVEDRARSAEAVRAIGEAALAVLGARPGLTVESLAPGSVGASVASSADEERRARREEAMSRARSHPAVAQAASILGARVKDIRIPE